MTTTVFTSEQISAAKAAYEAAQLAEQAAAKTVADLAASSANVISAYQTAKAAHDALKPSQQMAKAKQDMAAAQVKIARAEYAAVAPKEVAADTASRKGTGNKELLTMVQHFLATKPDGATNTEIYDALLSAGVAMAGADPRANLTSYLSRWGTAGVLVSKGTGKWGSAVNQAHANPFATTVLAPVEAAPVANPFAAPVANPFATPAPVELAPAVDPDTLGDDFPGVLPLRENGVTTKTQLIGVTKEQLVGLQGIGNATADKIIAAMA